jgi:hypothetical protein
MAIVHTHQYIIFLYLQNRTHSNRQNTEKENGFQKCYNFIYFFQFIFLTLFANFEKKFS